MEDPKAENRHGCGEPRVIVAIAVEQMCDEHARLLVELLTETCNTATRAYMRLIGKPVKPVEVQSSSDRSVN